MIHLRLRKIIDLKAEGSQTAFARLMGWTPQYLSRLVRAETGLGIQPVSSILEKFPDINARWFILGEGVPVDSGASKVADHLSRILSLEKYMPVMSTEQLREFTQEGRTDFSDATIAHWQSLLDNKNEFIENAIKRSSLCKIPNPRK